MGPVQVEELGAIGWVARWRAALDDTTDPSALDALATGVARKTLLAVAGLVSVSDSLADGLERLHTRLDPASGVTARVIDDMLTSTIAPIVAQFADLIGLWPDEA